MEKTAFTAEKKKLFIQNEYFVTWLPKIQSQIASIDI